MPEPLAKPAPRRPLDHGIRKHVRLTDGIPDRAAPLLAAATDPQPPQITKEP
jgi:hypothetical protein